MLNLLHEALHGMLVPITLPLQGVHSLADLVQLAALSLKLSLGSHEGIGLTDKRLVLDLCLQIPQLPAVEQHCPYRLWIPISVCNRIGMNHGFQCQCACQIDEAESREPDHKIGSFHPLSCSMVKLGSQSFDTGYCRVSVTFFSVATLCCSASDCLTLQDFQLSPALPWLPSAWLWKPRRPLHPHPLSVI